MVELELPEAEATESTEATAPDVDTEAEATETLETEAPAAEDEPKA